MPNREINLNQPTKGMNLDTHPMNLDGTKVYYKALNAKQESVDGEQLALTNETGNELCVSFKQGYVVMGALIVPERDMILYWLTNDDTKMSEIGMSDTSLDPCNYETIVSASQDCFGFTSNTPIHKITYNLTIKTFEIYWTDGTSSMKWIDLNNVVLNQDGSLDCNRIQIFPDYKTPCITVEEVLDSGSLITGAYQFFVAYANSKGEELSQYYAATNAVGIWEDQVTNRLDFTTSKSIKIEISNLDTSYQYINIAVGKNIDLVESFELAGFFPINNNSTFDYLYTGDDKLVRTLTTADIFARPAFYETAETLASQNNILMLGGLQEEEIINYQSIVNKVKGSWATYAIPETPTEGYTNGINTSNFRSYLRDEVYGLELAFVSKSGRISNGFHWPGPGVRPEDREYIKNADSDNLVNDPCSDAPSLQEWQVYNTAKVTDFFQDFTFSQDKSCYKGPYQYGEFASWESILNYPNNVEIWGELANQPIRHWKFPDCAISPIHDNAGLQSNFQHTIYPIGIKIDVNSLAEAIRSSTLTDKQKQDIVGVKVLRANRAAHKSIVGKGLIYNMGEYTRDNETFLYPNYPYNDLNPDVFIASQQVDQKSGQNESLRLNGFNKPDISKTRYTLHSPDTSFVRPPVSGYIKLETVEFGKSKSHIIQVENNAKYTMGTRQGLQAALAIGLVSILGYNAGFPQAAVEIHLENFLPTYNAMVDLLKKLIPYRQYGYQFNSIGNYSESITIPNDGNKIRRIVSNKYLEPGIIAVENDVAPINNYQRESSVYIRTNEQLPFPHEVTGVPMDNSRFTVGSLTANPTDPTDSQLSDYWNNLTLEERVYALGLPSSTDDEEATSETQVDFTWAEIEASNSNFVTIFTQYYEDNLLNLTLQGNSTPIVFRDISSYYASIKRDVPDQYGQMYSYFTIDTGFCYPFDINEPSLQDAPIIFGGDTFINRFGLKKKLPFFLTNTVGLPDDTDIFYDQLGNVGYPIYYLSTGPKEYTPSTSLMSKLNKAYQRVTDTSFGTGLGAAVSAGLTRFIPALTALVALIEDIASRIGIKNNNLDQYQNKGFWEEGIMYLFAYGIPYFFVESDVNIDYRQAENTAERNFYPNVGSDIPDFWLQEKNVSINFDNYYFYNKSLSKQNIENVFTHLPYDFKASRDAKVDRTTRVIYSLPSSLDDRQNNWTIFKANNFYDFPLTNGKLVDLNAVESEKVLARFENNSSLYNAYITLDTNQKAAIVGTGNMFTNPPIEFSRTDIGYTGTQHKLFNSTKYGHFWVDAKRGNIFLMDSSGGLKDISQLGMKNWFKENLPFKILRSFKNVPIDNNFTGVGLSSVWDNKYDRWFLTKKDYVPLSSDIVYDEINNVFKVGDIIVSLTDSSYFCDASWTVAYSPMTESWISFYSFIPDYYVEQNGYFESGLNSEGTLWNHHLRDEKQNYQSFYGKVYPFEIHTVTKASIDFEVLQSLQYRNEVYLYTTPYERLLRKDKSFDSACIYNVNQTSGNLDLVLNNKQDLRSGLFTKTNSNSISISLAEANQVYKFNQFYNLVKDNNDQPIISFGCANTIEIVNPSSMNYKKNDQLVKARLRSDWFKVKLANTIETKFKYIFKWLVDKTIRSPR